MPVHRPGHGACMYHSPPAQHGPAANMSAASLEYLRRPGCRQQSSVAGRLTKCVDAISGVLTGGSWPTCWRIATGSHRYVACCCTALCFQAMLKGLAPALAQSAGHAVASQQS